jgi:hypothetical protein
MLGIDSEPLPSRSRRLPASVYTWSSRARTGAFTLHFESSRRPRGILDSFNARSRPNHRSSSCLATGGVPRIETGKHLLRHLVPFSLRRCPVSRQAPCRTRRLTSRCSRRLAVLIPSDFMIKILSELASRALASRG